MVGHSTRSLEEFLEILKHFKIDIVVDVRKFPSSKKFPHFNKESLEQELNKNNIKYFHLQELGGFREEGYENFSKTEEFKEHLKKLVEIINDSNSVILCSERYFWRCHRKFVAQQLKKLGYEIVHILDKENVYEHKDSKDLTEKMNIKIFCDKIKKK